VSSPAEIKGQKWSIKNNVIQATVPGVPDHKMQFELDPTKSPKQMDLMPQYEPYLGTVTPAIYEVREGKLRVCSADPTDKTRPTDFTAGAMVFERVKR
jgi:uncharacterized protein (TIGR03067 family)